ncbi:hypothetical protein [Azospirillum agricola]|uniref:hypothetical protein n=1 Tax=Azospirillum agricola TaxID=1720247 RepID=UPI000A0F2ECC|nr:hypothetical protein [Azospirillum agricola]SMH58515.1 hypothetical protein SAMN02982994_4652 [Azospirillum lipoferum]
MAVRIARIIHMGKVGGYAARIDGALLEVDGRMLWPSSAALIMDARRIGVEVSTHVIDTSSIIGDEARPDFQPMGTPRAESQWTEFRRAA